MVEVANVRPDHDNFRLCGRLLFPYARSGRKNYHIVHRLDRAQSVFDEGLLRQDGCPCVCRVDRHKAIRPALRMADPADLKSDAMCTVIRTFNDPTFGLDDMWDLSSGCGHAVLRGYVREVPRPDSCSAAMRSFNGLVREREQRWWDREAKCLGGLEVDHELEFGRPQDRQVAWLLALEYPPGVDARLAIGISDAGRVAHQATGRDCLAYGKARRQRMVNRKRDEPFSVGEHEGAAANEHSTSPALNERCERGLDVLGAADTNNDEFLPERLRGRLHLFSFCQGVGTLRAYEHGL
jgi:hypothetical protein